MQRCKAKSKRSGQQCKNYALKHCTVCRMHGARGGPKTLEGYNACKTAPQKHGIYSRESLEELRRMRQLLKSKVGYLDSVNATAVD